MLELRHKNLDVWKKSIELVSEGMARSSNLETTRFLDIARSSLVELDTQIEIAIQIKYLKLREIDPLKELTNHTFAMLSKLIKKIKNDEKK